MCTRRLGPFATPHLRGRVLRSSTPRRICAATGQPPRPPPTTTCRWPRVPAGLRLPRQSAPLDRADPSLQSRRSPPKKGMNLGFCFNHGIRWYALKH
uniref:Uncharacterized protein n=1 Tax=Oryza punctata TaxID=4537 RepID=A0A0E0M1G1_ORYPU